MSAPELLQVYDLRDPAASEAARRHRNYWGRLYTVIHTLDTDHVALVFRPAPDERWRAFEQVRLRWILEDQKRVEREMGYARSFPLRRPPEYDSRLSTNQERIKPSERISRAYASGGSQ